MELTSPGSAGLFKGFRIRKGAVLELLMLVRTHYPGLEWHFDAERVASWDKPPQTWWGWFWSKLFYLIIILYVVGGIANLISGGSDEAATLTAEEVGEVRLAEKQDIVAQSLFGGALNWEELERLNPAYTSQMQRVIIASDQLSLLKNTRTMLRQDILRAREHADPDTLMAISRVISVGWRPRMRMATKIVGKS